MAGEAPEWCEVPADVVRVIAGMLVGIEDYVRFGAVCKSWSHALSSSRAADFPCSSKRHLEYPWLMLAEKEDDDAQGGETKKMREFYSFYSGKHFSLELPETYGRTCFGSSSGWLLTYGLDQQMHLLNPLTRRRLLLPAATTFADQYVSIYENDPYTPEQLRILTLRKVVIVTCTPDRVLETVLGPQLNLPRSMALEILHCWMGSFLLSRMTNFTSATSYLPYPLLV